LHKLPAGWIRMRISQYVGVLCLILAVVSALGFGRFLAGYGAGVKLGPIPEGVPVNVLANINPEASFEERYAALNALTKFVLRHQKTDGDKLQRRIEFEEQVAPALMNASKCPDFVTDRGHDYEFIRRLTDEEKRQLKALLKTF